MKILMNKLAIMLVVIVFSSLTAQATVNVGKKELILYTLPFSEKTIIGLAPSAMDQFVEFMDDYFTANTWQFKQIEFSRSSKGDKIIYEIKAQDLSQMRETFFHAYSLEIKPKTKRIQLKLTATADYIKKLREYEQDRGTYQSNEVLKNQMKEMMKAHLENIKDYWW